MQTGRNFSDTSILFLVVSRTSGISYFVLCLSIKYHGLRNEMQLRLLGNFTKGDESRIMCFHGVNLCLSEVAKIVAC